MKGYSFQGYSFLSLLTKICSIVGEFFFKNSILGQAVDIFTSQTISVFYK
jgi:hypothetical protein